MASLLSMAGLIACKDASLFHTFLCSRPPPSMFYKLLEIERSRLCGSRDAASHGSRCPAGWGAQFLVVKRRPPRHGTSLGDCVYPQRRAPWDLRVGEVRRCPRALQSHTRQSGRSPAPPEHLAQDAGLALVRRENPHASPPRRL